MRRFEEIFFDEMDLEKLDERRRNRFITIMRKEIETQIGNILFGKITEQQINEIEKLIRGSTFTNHSWLIRSCPEYRSSDLYISQKKKVIKTSKAIENTAQILWMKNNFSEYDAIADTCIDEFCKEMLSYKDLIFEG